MILYPPHSRTPVGRPRHEEIPVYKIAMSGWREWVGMPELEDVPLLA